MNRMASGWLVLALGGCGGDAVPTKPETAAKASADAESAAPLSTSERLAICSDLVFGWQRLPAATRAAKVVGTPAVTDLACADVHPYRGCFADSDASATVLEAAGEAWAAVVVAECLRQYCPRLSSPLCPPTAVALDTLPEAQVVSHFVDFHVAMLAEAFHLEPSPELHATAARLAELWHKQWVAAQAEVEPVTADFWVHITAEGFELRAKQARVWPHAKGSGKSTTSSVAPSATTRGIWDFVALEAAAQAVSIDAPDDHRVHIVADAQVPFQVLMDTMDALRGSDCDVAPEGPVDPTTCFFWKPIVESPTE